MATAMMVAVGVLALLVFVLCGVVYELFRDVRQLRDVAGILDRPLHVELGTSPVRGLAVWAARGARLGCVSARPLPLGSMWYVSVAGSRTGAPPASRAVGGAGGPESGFGREVHRVV